MLGKRSRPVQRTQNKSHFIQNGPPPSGFFNAPRVFIGFAPKIAAEASGDGSRSPTSPLDTRRCFETLDSRSKPAVGLSILAALHRESKVKNDLLSTKNSAAKSFYKEFRLQSQPIPIKTQAVRKEESDNEDSEVSDLEYSESYTCVTTHGPESVTRRVYVSSEKVEDIHSSKMCKKAIFEASSFTEEPSFPSTDFLSACFLCRRSLCPGKDIYMYRGDRAFCSEECRYQQIVSDEKRERCASSSIKHSTSQQRHSHYHQPKTLFTMAAA
eukprot:TRINITY_DN4322_c0_g1_i1.p1 TRINITY_DN4322_c0_g1~~TRINITY_DN4322_c0_g1_i1.p1  ORF type:complete len:270 (-),score=25.61 TRINITY_DN4322_c0_g1_i1:967-1776(-)